MGSLSNFEFQILAVLGSEELSGREVAKAHNEQTGGTISYGTLYTTLRRLKEAGFVETRDSEDTDGRIRYFRINGHGRAALRESYREVSAFASLAQKALRA